jgi:hypothetical protein
LQNDPHLFQIQPTAQGSPRRPRAPARIHGHFFLHAVLRATRVPPRLRPTCRYRSRRASLPRSRTTTEDVRPVRRRVPPSSARLSCAPAKCVTPVFLAPNKQPNKSRVFSNFPAELIYPLSEPRLILSPRRACRKSRRHRLRSGRRPSRVAPAPRSATTPGIPRTPRSHRPVRLAITAVPELTPVSEKPRKIRKNPSPNFPRNSPNFLNPFSIFFPYFPFYIFIFFLFLFLFLLFLSTFFFPPSSSFGGSCRDPRPRPPTPRAISLPGPAPAPPSPLAEPGQQARRRGTPRPAPQPARPCRPSPSIALTGDDQRSPPPLFLPSGRSPPPQPQRLPARRDPSTAPRCPEARRPKVNARIFFSPGHRSSWSSNIFTEPTFPHL